VFLKTEYLLSGCPIGRIMRLARPSVRPLARVSRTARNSRTKKRRKTKIDIDLPHGTSKCSANFSLNGQTSRSQDIKKTQKSGVIFTYGRQRRRIKRGRRRLHTRSTPLLGLLFCRSPKPPDNGTDGRIQCRCGQLLFYCRRHMTKQTELIF